MKRDEHLKFLPHLVGASFDAGTVIHFALRSSHSHTVNFIFELLEVGCLLDERVMMQRFVDEPNKQVCGVFIKV